MEYTIAMIQERSEWMNKAGSLEKACHLIGEAAGRGARLVVFPEAWLPGYPWWALQDSAWESPQAKANYRSLYENAFDRRGAEVKQLSEACARHHVFLAMGVNERTDSGTIYNSLAFYDDTGALLGLHRKLVPTYHERLVWGQGDGSSLHVFDTATGRLSGLICYEHLMPLARYVMYARGAQIHVAVWPKATNPYLIACRNMAVEGRLYVVVASHNMSALVGPDGEFVIEPTPEPATVYGSVNLDRIIEEKQILDVVGHYARPDVFHLVVNTAERPSVVTTENPNRA